MWLLWSLGNAFMQSLGDALSKNAYKHFDEYILGWAGRFFSLILLIPLALTFGKDANPDKIFWYATLGSAAINSITTILYIRAIKNSELSIVLPIVTLSPVFLIITSPIINREFPSFIGIVGVLISVLGTYFLNFSKWRQGILHPFIALWNEKGARDMLIVAMLWSISAPLDKLAVTHSNPYFYVATVNALIAFVFILILYAKKQTVFTSSGIFKKLAPLGMLYGLSITFQMIAFSLTLVPYAISVKRISSFFGIIWGKLFFGETKLKDRLVGSIIIIVGATIIVFAQ